jgi:hypothetical protein
MRKGKKMMKMWKLVFTLILGLFFVGPFSAVAGEWRVPLGLTFVSGVGEIVDQIEANMETEVYDVESTQGLPMGISLQPYYEFDSGLGVGGGIGPFMLGFGDASYMIIPMNVSLRYAFMPKSRTAPYLRLGASTLLASGDYFEGGQLGFIGAVGVEFMRDKAVQFGIEAGYDSSSIKMEDLPTGPTATKTIEPVGFLISIFAVF